MLYVHYEGFARVTPATPAADALFPVPAVAFTVTVAVADLLGRGKLSSGWLGISELSFDWLGRAGLSSSIL